MALRDQLLDRTQKHLSNLGYDGGPVLAAVSGGADSSVLALVLAELARRGRLGALSVGHVDHGVQRDSVAAAQCVSAFGYRLGVRVHCRTLALPSTPSEKTMREARYSALTDLAREAGARWVMTAHHEQDDIETVWFRLIRGMDPRALRGIPARRTLAPGVELARPLLRENRDDLTAVALEARLQTWTDRSNLDPQFARNRLRHDLLPRLRSRHGDRIDHDALAVAHAARTVGNRLAELVGRFERSHVRWPTRWRAELRAGEGWPTAILSEVAYRLGSRLRGTPLPSDTGRRIAELFGRPTGARVEGPGALLAERTRDGVIMLDVTAAGRPPATPPTLDPDGGTPFGTTGWQIVTRSHARPPAGWPGSHTRALLDPRFAPAPWRLRTRRAGDTVQLLGAEHPARLKGILINRGIPRFDRDRLPLVVDAEDRILWIPGAGLADSARIRTDTTSCLEVEVRMAGGMSVPAAQY